MALLLLAAAARPARAAEAGTLSFGEDGTFTVMLISDVQDLPVASSYYTKALSAALDDCAPDFVVFMGDQLNGASAAYGGGEDAKDDVRRAILDVLRPVSERSIPFAAVLGPADADAGVGEEFQLAVYRSVPGFLPQDAQPGFRYAGVSAFGGGADILNLYFFDTFLRAADGGAGAVSSGQIERSVRAQEDARVQNGGETVPSVSFLHGAVPELYEAFDEASSVSSETFSGSGVHRDSIYRKDSEAILFGSINETPTVSTDNSGLFDALCEQGDVFLTCFGGDHTNAFLTAFNGMDLVSVPGASYVAENDRQTRGAMLLRFSEDNVRDYEIRFVPFSDYENLNAFSAVYYYLSTSNGIPAGAKIAFFAGVILLAFALMLILDGRKKGVIPAPYDDGKEDIPLGSEQPPKADKDK